MMLSSVSKHITGTLALLSAPLPGQLQWTQAAPPLSPTARQLASMAFDGNRGTTILFGGRAANGLVLQETWQWDGSQWRQEFVSPQPPPMIATAMAYDPRRQRVVLFGGCIVQTGLSDQTWEWNGTSWTFRAVALRPPPRIRHRMAFDEVRGTTILFGGVGPTELADTWEWDGSRWLQLQPTHHPSARWGHVMVSDQARNRIVLYGGQTTIPNNVFGDTWEWDGSDWALRAPTALPPRREIADGCFDARRGRMVLFGGLGAEYPYLGYQTDAWDWDGTAWVLRAYAGGPPPGRENHSMAYDPLRGQTVLFGGFNATGVLGDTWEYGPTYPAETVPYGHACAGSVGTPAHSAQNLPWLGDTYGLTTAPLPAPALGFLFLGFDRTQWNGIPLPLDLTPAGMPGCTLDVEIPLLAFAGSPNATLTWSLPIGTTPDLLGFSFFTQSLHLDPLANPLGATTSNALRHRIGGR